MRIVVQRSKNASVTVNNKVIGEIEKGLVLLVGVTHDDTTDDANYLADKIVNLRIFEDENGKMNLSLLDVGGSILRFHNSPCMGIVAKEEDQILWELPNLNMRCISISTLMVY